MNRLNEVIKDVEIEEEVKKSYIDYAMSVIVGRALPDVRDGLKPVHRRILYAMHDMGMFHNKPFKKSARIVGEVLGKYHPHGDAAVYDTMVRMVQDFNMRYPLLDGQGNFGSVDGDPAAAMRYTEARMSRIAEELLQDIDKDTVDFVPNFDGSLKEPVILPAKFPNLLVNGSSGIAVGMSTSIPPHNLNEVVDAIVAYIDNPDITIDELMEHIKGPDFPTGGIIVGVEGIRKAYKTGRGIIKVRASASIERDKNGKEYIIIDEMPYQVNKASVIEHIAKLVNEKKIEGIADLRDESDKEGMRVVVELKKYSNSNVILNKLFKHTNLETSYSIILLALVDNQPEVLNLKNIIKHYVDHRFIIITRRTKYELAKLERRAHILEGLLIALKHIDEIIELIKKSKDPQSAKEKLMLNYALSEIQAQAILDMKLQRLTGLEQEKLKEEYKEVIEKISELKSILESKYKILDMIKNDLLELKEKYGDERRTEIVLDAKEIKLEDLISNEEMVVTITNNGYIKRMPLKNYRKQGRGGRGVTGIKPKEDDFIEHIFIALNHDYILIFTSKGKVHWLKVYEIPEAGRLARGKAIVNILPLDGDEYIRNFLAVRNFNEEKYVMFITKKGIVKKTHLKHFSNPRRGGIIAIDLQDRDDLIDVKLTDGKDEIILATRNGKALRFKEIDVRPMGRTARGVRGMSLTSDDEIIGVCKVRDHFTVITITENGYGKRTKFDEYRIQKRGGKGIINIKTTQRNGKVVSIKEVTDENDVIISTKNGIMIRFAVREVSIIGRNTQGVRLIRLDENDKVASVAVVRKEDDFNNENLDNN